jgi:Tfp pilus assembly protein PilZ
MNDIGDLDHRIMELVSPLPIRKKYQLLYMLKDWRQGQHRCEDRESCLIPVDISIQNRVFRDFIYNISSRGAFIETKAPFIQGQYILLAFSSPNGRKHYKLSGIIVRNDAKGVGVRFIKKIKKENHHDKNLTDQNKTLVSTFKE